MTGIPKSERWWLWAFLLWIIFALGPGLNLANKAIFIGYFPLLYVYALAMYVISLVLIYFLTYKLKFTDVPEKFDDVSEDVRRDS